MKIERVLIVDDDPVMRDFLVETLLAMELDVYSAASGADALEVAKKAPPDLMITDMQMPKMTGLELIKRMKGLYPSTMIVVITAYGSIDNAVEAMRLGAFNYLLKPFTPDMIEALLNKMNEHYALIHENSYVKAEAGHSAAEEMQVIGESPAMKEILASVDQIAKSNASVFIHGESGTGKEVIAELIHRLSPRHDKPFIKVNCAAVPETLIESEFFGHEKGSFTGATSKRLGRFELANSGTLLLDEISEIPLSLQAKLLRVTQEQLFERVGGTKPVKVDVRLISTSNREVQDLIDQKVMREDLFYRLNVVPLYLPPLRERQEDILPLAHYFLEKFSGENHKPLKALSKEAENKLLYYSWPGNIRELANILERAVVTSRDGEKEIQPEEIYIDILSLDRKSQEVPMTLKELEKKFILDALKAHNQSSSEAAKTLGISETHLIEKLKEFGVV